MRVKSRVRGVDTAGLRPRDGSCCKGYQADATSAVNTSLLLQVIKLLGGGASQEGNGGRIYMTFFHTRNLTCPLQVS